MTIDTQDSTQEGTELDVPLQVVHPVTGELLTVDHSTEALAQYLLDVRDLETGLRVDKKAVTTEILRRQDRAASWTTHAGSLKVSGQSPAPMEVFDGLELRNALGLLVDAGVITVEAMDAAVVTEVKYTPRKAGIAALRKLGGEVKKVVDGLAVEREPERRVTVSR